jgi:transporter family-2 protein
MQALSAAWLYPLILLAGALQAGGPPMNGKLRKSPMNGALRTSLENSRLASTVSFLPVLALLLVLWLCQPNPMPSPKGIASMPWWAPLGGLIGAFAVIMALPLVDKVGAGPFAGLTITANILMSLAIGHFGWFGIRQHGLNIWRVLGGAPMTGGIVLITLF